MKVLAIDTSTMLGGIAIMDDLSLLAEIRLNVKSTHSERLMTEIEHCIRQSGIKISDIDVFAAAIGPGSFTGLRIGLSTVKGLSYATGKPIVSVPTLEALAWNFTYSKYPVCTMLDARKKEVYAALFRWEEEGRSGEFSGDTLIRLIPETSVMPEDFLRSALPAASSDKFIFTGEGTMLYKDTIIAILGEKAIFAPPEKMVPSPANVAYLGRKKALAGKFAEPLSLIPLYIRKSEAEIKDSLKFKAEGLVIREMAEKDIPEVARIERMSFTTPWSETSFFNGIYNPRYITKVAVIGEGVIGYICANQVSDEGHILNLAVHPDFRERGIAKVLVENILGDLRENACRFLYLEVRASNHAACKLYEGFGFKVVGTRKGYYNEPREDAIIMMLAL